MEQNSQPENAITTPVTETPETKKSKAPLIGMISLGVLAVAGCAFGAISLVDANKKSTEISDLKAQIAQLNQNTNNTTNPDNNTNTTPDNTTNQPTNNNTTTNNTQSPNETLSLAEQLAKAYKSRTGEDYAFDNVTSANIKNSTVSPYQTLETGFAFEIAPGAYGGGVAMFYRTSPDAEWQYFTTTQSLLTCSEYNTDSLRKAYAGEPCYESDYNYTQTTVQP